MNDKISLITWCGQVWSNLIYMWDPPSNDLKCRPPTRFSCSRHTLFSEVSTCNNNASDDDKGRQAQWYVWTWIRVSVTLVWSNDSIVFTVRGKQKKKKIWANNLRSLKFNVYIPCKFIVIKSSGSWYPNQWKIKTNTNWRGQVSVKGSNWSEVVTSI